MTLSRGLGFDQIALFILCAALAVGTLMAQTASTGALSGTVTDSTGGVIPNVTVTLTSTDTNQARTATTGADGTYKFGLLPPGDYKVRFAASGFKTAEVPQVTINVTENPVVDRVLDVGQQSEQVTVEAAAETLQTATSTLGTTVTNTNIEALPLSNRNYTQVLSLSAGVTVAVANATTYGKGTQDMSVNGSAVGSNNYSMDGVSIRNFQSTNSVADSGSYAGIGIPSPDAIQEFKIQTSTYDASYGREPGASVNVVTRSGTNQFHGSAFEYFRNSVLNANDFFYNLTNPASSTTKQVLDQNQPGGTIGGPIKKDKLFFFGSYEYTYSRNGITGAGVTTGLVLPPIPSGPRNAPGFAAALGAADCHLPVSGPALACDGSNVNPIAVNILNLQNPVQGGYYVPSSATSGLQTVSYFDPAVYKENQFIINEDYLLNSKNTISGRYFYTRNPQFDTLGGALPGTPQTIYVANHDAVLKLTTIITNNLVNEVRASGQRNEGFNNFNTLTPAMNQTGIQDPEAGSPIPPTLAISLDSAKLFQGFAPGGGGPGAPSFVITNQFQEGDNLSWSHGKHTIRTGFEIELIDWNTQAPSHTRGAITVNNWTDLFVGQSGSILSTSAMRSTNPNGIINGFRAKDFSGYGQDDYKVNAKLTLNIGLRWEYDGYMTDKYGNLTNISPTLLNTMPVPPTSALGIAANYTGISVPNNYTSNYGGVPPPSGVYVSPNGYSILGHPPYTNFAPRLGFAYQLSSKLVVRGGAGLFYDRVAGDALFHGFSGSFPYGVPVNVTGPNNVATLAVPFPAIPAAGTFQQRYANPATLTGSNIGLMGDVTDYPRTPLIREYNLNVQYNFAPTWVLEIAYVGSDGINLLDGYHNLNTPLLASASNPINGLTTNTTANAPYRTPYLGYTVAGVPVTAFDLTSNFNSLQTTVRKQLSRGLTMQIAYTWSKAMGDGYSGNGGTSVGAGNESSANSNNPNNLAQQYGPAIFNRDQRVIINYSYQLPLGNRTGFEGKLLNGWSLSGLTTVQSGNAMTVADTRGGTIWGISGSRGEICPGVTYSSMQTSGASGSRLGGAGGGPGWFNPGSFCIPPAIGNGTDFGSSGVGIVTGPGQFNFDVTLQKLTRITERQTVTFRAEFFNIFNHPQFSDPTLSVTSATFGQITSSAVNPRIIQLALRYQF